MGARAARLGDHCLLSPDAKGRTSMQRSRGELQDVQQSRNAPCSGNSIGEHQRAPWMGCQDVVQQLVPLLVSTVQRGLLNLSVQSRRFS